MISKIFHWLTRPCYEDICAGPPEDFMEVGRKLYEAQAARMTSEEFDTCSGELEEED